MCQAVFIRINYLGKKKTQPNKIWLIPGKKKSPLKKSPLKNQFHIFWARCLLQTYIDRPQEEMPGSNSRTSWISKGWLSSSTFRENKPLHVWCVPCKNTEDTDTKVSLPVRWILWVCWSLIKEVIPLNLCITQEAYEYWGVIFLHYILCILTNFNYISSLQLCRMTAVYCK